MVLKKQTVWLLSMLAILVVLSAYYLVQGPTQQVPMATGQMNDQGVLPAGDGKDKGIKVSTKQVTPHTDGVPVASPSDDYFIGYKMQRDAQQEQELGRYMEAMTNANTKPAAKADAKKNYDELSARKDNQDQVEELVKAIGSYKDVVVIAKDDMVRVLVQTDNLKKDKAVEIINLVKQQMKVPGNNIVVNYKP
ncbi:stage III sporulation protein AH [Aneurinibacillus soli]|uniref:Stage III sporulation protein AH n=1 Tax=Aneurinibacillus soli TaxID=1500254 RepID=A0A0U5BGW2_9BACL|nr:SpoIIIAH-like family protein [Aneurinibacillus soli]PYE63645.1 stage III sporulation protein AH [Aneurinibacillus soli]BAU27422.1 Stage III sporulation protein AH [Aneurinibacillus soli]